MILYHVTVSIAHFREDEWSQWMKQHHIPDVVATGLFLEASMSKQTEPPPPEGHTTYHIVYQCPSEEALARYQRDFAPQLQREHTEKYQGTFQANRVIAQLVQHFPSSITEAKETNP